MSSAAKAAFSSFWALVPSSCNGGGDGVGCGGGGG